MSCQLLVRLVSYVLITLPILSVHAETPVNVEQELGFSTDLNQQDLRSTAEISNPLSSVSSQNGEEGRPLTIAMLMPPDGSPFLPAARIVGNGLIAANRTSSVPANVLLVETTENISVLEQLHAAVIAGADVIIGPLQKNRVEALAKEESLPLPVVALNIVQEQAYSAPSNLLMMSVSTELEASWIAGLALRALPEETKGGLPPKVLILTQDQPWETRIANAYKEVLIKAGIPHETMLVNAEELGRLTKFFEPQLSEEDKEYYRENYLPPIDASVDPKGAKAQKIHMRKLDQEMRVRAARGEPPYYAALLALDAQTASLVRSRLPLRTRVWATSSTNPGDPLTSPAAMTLIYDLNKVVFSEAPLVINYSADSFEARYQTSIPFSPAAKRLFALGVDAYRVAEKWSVNAPLIEFKGETGMLHAQRAASAIVDRTPQVVVIQRGQLIPVEPEDVLQPELPDFKVPVLTEAPKSADMSVNTVPSTEPSSTEEHSTIKQEQTFNLLPTTHSDTNQ